MLVTAFAVFTTKVGSLIGVIAFIVWMTRRTGQ